MSNPNKVKIAEYGLITNEFPKTEINFATSRPLRTWPKELKIDKTEQSSARPLSQGYIYSQRNYNFSLTLFSEGSNSSPRFKGQYLPHIT